MRRPLQRRPALRGGRRPARPEGRPVPRRMLLNTNRLLAEGQFSEASLIFARLSEGAAQHDMPVRAGELALRASHAFIRSGEVGAGIDGQRRGSGILHVQAGHTGSLRDLLTQPRSSEKPRMIPRPTSSNKTSSAP